MLTTIQAMHEIRTAAHVGGWVIDHSERKTTGAIMLASRNGFEYAAISITNDACTRQVLKVVASVTPDDRDVEPVDFTSLAGITAALSAR